ncbi:TetR/AcrR family transcriptional regulator [Micromonospora sp. NPDC002717]|uniref:TetR/AcrR family transcriptional regulator n=1 Tax=Micromonospora sp. NPDC002717 TaxID=3154424 RepID=UPI00331922C5
MITETSPRDRIVRAAAALLAEGGREAVSTRAVSRAAGVQAPTIYRQFGDMRGLLDAAASYGFAAYLHAEASRDLAGDPVDDLRRGWELHVGFGLANPACHALMYGDPRPGETPTAARVAADILRQLVHRVAEAGRLRAGVDEATEMLHAAACGVTLALIRTPPPQRDPALSTRTREAVLAALVTDSPAARATSRAGNPVRHAVALRAALDGLTTDLSPAERALLAEWLDRIVRTTPTP